MKLQLRLNKVEPSFENNEIINYFRLGLLKDTKLHSIVYSHPLGDNAEFHKLIEDNLKTIGYQKFKWNNKKDNS